MEFLWWHWAILGFGLILSELMIPAFFMVWFGLGAFLVAMTLAIWIDMPLTGQIIVWTISSIMMTILWFRVFKTNYHKILTGRASAALIGEIGMIAAAVAPFKNGKVRFQKPMIGSDIWDCSSKEEITAGTRVRVESVEGNTVTVSKLEE